jgi:hypothetical protein
MSVNIDGGHDIGRAFLDNLDKFLRENWHELTCKDIYNLYFTFWENLKKFKGNSGGFTGLSEYLIFRFLFHYLGGNFKREAFSDETYKFVRKDCSIGHNLAISVGDSKKCEPDIVVWQGGELNLENLQAVIQIKIFFVKGLKTIKEVMDEFEQQMQANSSGFRALLITYDHKVKDEVNSPIRQELKRLRQEKGWFSYVVLQDIDKPFKDILDKSLNLR